MRLGIFVQKETKLNFKYQQIENQKKMHFCYVNSKNAIVHILFLVFYLFILKIESQILLGQKAPKAAIVVGSCKIETMYLVKTWTLLSFYTKALLTLKVSKYFSGWKGLPCSKLSMWQNQRNYGTPISMRPISQQVKIIYYFAVGCVNKWQSLLFVNDFCHLSW